MMVSNPLEAPMRILKPALAAVVVAGALLFTIRWTLARSVAPEPQPAPQDTTRISAGLLRRLAAAADAYRTGEPVWVVASANKPYQVEGVYEDLSEARRHTRFIPGGQVFGPYVTPLDEDRVMIFVPTRHVDPTIYMLDSSPGWALPSTPWAMARVDSVVITAYNHGETWRGFSRGNVDAVFFTLSAFDKFVSPYYSALSGADVATQMRQPIVQYIRRAPVETIKRP